MRFKTRKAIRRRPSLGIRAKVAGGAAVASA
jgi:hypothetical protein